jgi:hypothetical protein
MFDAGVSGEDSPGPDMFAPIWDAWNSKSPDLKATDCKTADAALIEHIESLDAQQLDKLHLSMFGMEVDATLLTGMRLSEHSLHTWDVDVVRNPSATLASDATALMIDVLSTRGTRSAKPVGGPLTVRIETTAPARSFVLRVDDSVSLDEGSGSTSGDTAATADGATAKLTLPAEALLRLASGRLDDEHLPAGTSIEGVNLDALRSVFPGL